MNMLEVRFHIPQWLVTILSNSVVLSRGAECVDLCTVNPGFGGCEISVPEIMIKFCSFFVVEWCKNICCHFSV